MAKKKKLQLKPSAARGFATQSVPKKVVELQTEPEIDQDPSSAAATPESASASETLFRASDSKSSAVGTPQADEFDPDRAEQQSLQNLVDKFQERTEKEVVRTVKAIEQDRRHSNSKEFSRLDLDPSLVDRILELVRDSTPGELGPAIEEPEEKVIPQLAITYGVLRRIGHSEETVEECLRSISGVDLQQAYEWLHLHLSEEALQWHHDKPAQRKYDSTRSQDKMGKRPQAATSERSYSESVSAMSTPGPATPRTPASPLNPHAQVFTPTTGFSSPPSRDETHTPQKIEVEDALPLTDMLSGSDSPLDDPNAWYARLKVEIEDLTTFRKPDETRDAMFLRTLQRRLEEVQKDYLFDESEAEAAYQAERVHATEARLRQPPPAPVVAASDPPIEPIVDSLPATPAAASESNVSVNNHDSVDIFEEDDGDASGGLLELLDDLPATETSPAGTIIQIRDMALPKRWSGRTPRVLLLDAVKKLDRYATVEYRDVSGASRAKRASVCIRWTQEKVGEWTMENVACHDLAQAEQYISLVALHALTFPPMEGFAIGSTSVSTSQTFFRLLPAVFRDLWDELETQRRLDDDATNRAVWAKLRDILEAKLKERTSVEKVAKSTQDSRVKPKVRNPQQNEASPEQIMAAFAARQASFEYQEMLHQRNTLPIASFRNEIMDTLDRSQVLVLSGETGCGKSTQVPSFILEDQLSQGLPCKILCTEPRRISAISLATRVSRELGEPPGVVGTLGSLVGYSIRLESITSKTTRLTFVTNGIALRMLEGGSGPEGHGTAFDDITHIVIDEVHERTIESDFLLIVLKSLVKQRPDLKVVLMSATLNAEKISNYFNGCAILQVPGRTFPVDVCYLEDAIEFTQWRVTEDSPYAVRGYDKYSRNKARNDWSEDTALGDDEDAEATQEQVKLEKRYSDATAATINLLDERLVPYELILRLLELICLQQSKYSAFSSAILIFMPGMGEIRRMHEVLIEHNQFGSEDLFRLYPLHSTIASDQQAAVFDIPPPGVRKIVIATNIAETGITIPDITCVIDTGRHREMRFDEKRQLSRLVDTFVAKSNATQRRGRAGRVQSGLCFHLFTKTRFDTKMAEHPDPEIMRLSLSDLALRIKIMKVDLGNSIEDVLSRALDPPSPINVQRAISALVEVRALTPQEDITPMGRLLSKMPTDVHLGKFLLIASIFRCLDAALTIAATLSSKSPFVVPFGKEDEANRQKMSFRTENSDFLTIHNAFSSWRRAVQNGGSAARNLCRKAFLSYQNLQQIEELRQQLFGYLVDSAFIQVDSATVRELNRSRYGRGRTRFVPIPPELDYNGGNSFLLHAALCAGLYPKIISTKEGKLVTVAKNQLVFFHPSSINFGRKSQDFGVNYLCYFTIMQSKKMYAWETGPVDDLALVLLCNDPDFRLDSGSVLVDNKVRFRVGPKTNVALKFLRDQLAALLASQFRGRPLSETQIEWNSVAMTVLGKLKSSDDAERRQDIMGLVVNKAVS